MKKIICWFKGHRRGKTWYSGKGSWHVECKKCGFVLSYISPFVRLIGTETKFGFDGS